MFRILGWFLGVLAFLLAIAALLELYMVQQVVGQTEGGFSFSAFLSQLAAPSLTALCATSLAILARRFLVRARRRAAQRARRADVDQMTDLFS
jgi:hypothetical protein